MLTGAEMNSELELSVGDDPEFEDLVAEITYENQLVCLLSQERGFDLLEIEIHAQKSGEPWHFEMRKFQDALDRAKERLWDLRKDT
jgi:hypothetical protein